MASYSVFAGGLLIGHSQLEQGDAPMGVAFGVFRPTPAYTAIRHECVAAVATGAWEPLRLSVRAATGQDIPAQGGIMILDADTASPDEMEVQVAGISYPLYEELFPEHVRLYLSKEG